jgi:hypothetical protein
VISEICAEFGIWPSLAEREYVRSRSLIDGIFEHRTVKRALELSDGGKAGAEALAANPRYLAAIEQLRMVQYQHIYDELGTPFGDSEEGLNRWLRIQSETVEG